MKRILGIAMILLVAGGVAAQEVHIDYDRSARLTTFKTFGWQDTPETSLAGTNDLMHERIKTIVIDMMSSGRLDQVTTDPDLWVTYHANTRDQFKVNTASFGYGYPGNWYWDPYWGGSYTTSTVSTYTEGTLVIDIWDAKEKTLIWRGSAVITVAKNPEKTVKRIEKAVTKIGNKWQKMKPGF